MAVMRCTGVAPAWHPRGTDTTAPPAVS